MIAFSVGDYYWRGNRAKVGKIYTVNLMELVLYSRMKALRVEKKMTQQQVANALGLNSVTYLRYEKGQRQMPLELLPMIADLFDVSLDYLFGRTDF